MNKHPPPPDPKTLWIDGRCGGAIFLTLGGVILFSVAVSFRNAGSSTVAPVLTLICQMARFSSYAMIVPLTAPSTWFLRRLSWFLVLPILVAVWLLIASFAPPSPLGEQPFASWGVRLPDGLAAFCFLLAAGLAQKPAFLAGVATQREWMQARRKLQGARLK